MSAELGRMSAVEMRQRIVKKELSPVEITKRALEAAESTQKTLNAFSSLMPEAALAAARQAEDSVMKGEKLGPLHGVPFSVKDLIAVKDVIYASGSKTMAKNVAAVNAPSVERAKAAGGILIGKTTTSEFGCKPVGDNLLTGITRNPWNLNKTPGGSSAGAAASVAAGITPFALGTDGRVDPRSVQLFRAVRNQGAFWPRPGLADLGDADPGPCRAHSQGSPRRRAAVQRHCRL